VVTDPSLLDPPATVVERRGHTHLARDGYGERLVDGPRRPGTIGEIDCRDCRILAKLQHARGEHPGGTL
jgi:hypothetical protein